jgi:hypothetical protein
MRVLFSAGSGSHTPPASIHNPKGHSNLSPSNPGQSPMSQHEYEDAYEGALKQKDEIKKQIKLETITIVEGFNKIIGLFQPLENVARMRHSHYKKAPKLSNREMIVDHCDRMTTFWDMLRIKATIQIDSARTALVNEKQGKP